MGHFGGQQEGGHAPANVISKGDYYIMSFCQIGLLVLWFKMMMTKVLMMLDCQPC